MKKSDKYKAEIKIQGWRLTTYRSKRPSLASFLRELAHQGYTIKKVTIVDEKTSIRHRVGVKKIIGWRLDLVRTAMGWHGGAYSAAHNEFISLLLKATYGLEPIRVLIYMDDYTMRHYYAKWFENAGIDKTRFTGLIEFVVIDMKPAITPNLFFEEEEYLREEDEYMRKEDKYVRIVQNALKRWERYASEVVDKNLEGIDCLSADSPPEWIDTHQRTPYDCITAVWIDE